MPSTARPHHGPCQAWPRPCHAWHGPPWNIGGSLALINNGRPFPHLSLSLLLPSLEGCIPRSHRGHSQFEPQPQRSHPLFLSFLLSLLPPIPSLDFSLRHVNPPSALTPARNQARVTARQEDHRPLNRNFCPRLRSPQSTPLPRFLPSLSFSPSLSLSISLLLSSPAFLFAVVLSLARDRVGETMTSGPSPSVVVVVDGGPGVWLPSTVLSGQHPSSLPSLSLSLPFPLSLRLEHASHAMPGTWGQAVPGLVR